MKQSKTTAPKVVEDCHELLEWIIPKLDRFPRNRRFTLGERLESGLLHVLENLIAATYQKSNINNLKAANLQLDIVRHLWRLSHGLKAISHQSYGQGSERLTDLGRQIRGWQKHRESARLARGSGYNFRRKLRRLAKAYRKGNITLQETKPHVAGWLGHARQADSKGLCKAILSKVSFAKGGSANRSPCGSRRFVEQQPTEPPLG